MRLSLPAAQRYAEPASDMTSQSLTLKALQETSKSSSLPAPFLSNESLDFSRACAHSALVPSQTSLQIAANRNRSLHPALDIPRGFFRWRTILQRRVDVRGKHRQVAYPMDILLASALRHNVLN